MNRLLDAIGKRFSTIRRRVLLITFLPLLIAASGLTATTIYLRQHDSEKNLQQFIDTTLDNLSSSAEFGMYSGNIDMLRRITNSPLKNPYTAGIIFYNADDKLFLNVGAAPVPAKLSEQYQGVLEFNNLRYYIRPIVLLGDDLMDQSNADIVSRRIGWVALAITREPLAALHRQILLTSLIAFTVIFSLSLLLANRIGRSISRPISKIANTVSAMEAGNRNKRAPIIGTEETRALAYTLNRLADSFEDTNLDLQTRIEQATKKLQNALLDVENRNTDLEEIRIDLESALSAKDAFLARMSHELRTPLTSVIGFNRLLDGSPLSTQQRQYSHNIEQSSALLLSTIEDILDFSKLESDAMVLESIDFDLLKNVEDLIALQACNVYNKDVELVLLLEHDVPTHLQGDPARLKQVLNNLLSNALKFTDRGEVILRISLSQLDDDCATLQFMVKDSGIGIAREHLRNLFQPFQQADNTISRRFGGTGLGLTICQQLIEKMGGDIAIYSTPNVGTEVSFNLALPLAASTVIDRNNAVVDFPTLIIDTMPWSRRALRNQLSLWLNEIYSMGSHEQAINLLRQGQHNFRVVILSLHHSQLNEVSASKLLSALREYYNGPILLLAGSVDFEGHEFQAIQHQFAPLYLLTKPARRQELVDSLFSIHKLTSVSTVDVANTHQSTHGALHDLRILIVEDNVFNRDLLQSIIHLHGGKPIVAYNGDMALRVFSQQTFDAILIDMHMPVLNGIETVKIIRQRQQHAVVIIGLTADLHSGNIDLLRAAGADEVLSKPINEELLLRTLCDKLPRDEMSSAAIKTSGLLSTNSAKTKPALLAELQHLSQLLRQQLLENDVVICRETTHQLLGLAGLFGMQEIEKTVRSINDYLHSSPLPEARTTLLHTNQQLTEQIDQELSMLAVI